MDTRTSPARLRIERIRDALRQPALAAVLVPSSDPHLSEYLPERWQGAAVALGLHRLDGHAGRSPLDRAALFADSRYWVQAEAELAGSGIELVKIPTGAATQHVDWLCRDTCARGADASRSTAQVLGLAAAQQLEAALDARRHRAAHRPRRARRRLARPPGAAAGAPVYEHRRAAGAAVAAPPSWQRVRAAMARHGATHHFVSTVDDIAWLAQPARRRRRLQPGLPRPPADRRRAARRCSSATARSTPALTRSARRRRRHDRALRRRPRRARRAAGRRDAAARPEARHARPARAACRRRASSRRSTRARSPRAARATPRPPRPRARWSRTARRCASSTPGSSRRWPTTASADHRADDRREARPPRAPGGRATSA